MTTGTIDLIYKYGALPLLCVAVYILWKKTERHDVSIQKLNDEHKQELRNNLEELKSLHQSTLQTLTELTAALKK